MNKRRFWLLDESRWVAAKRSSSRGCFRRRALTSICVAAIMAVWSVLAPVAWAGSENENADNSLKGMAQVPALAELKAKAEATGRPVRILVKVRPHPLWPEPLDAGANAHALEQAKALLTNRLRDAGVVLVQDVEGTALIVTELSAEQMDVLSSTGVVDSVQEDELGRAFHP
jgi:hypothetical protein